MKYQLQQTSQFKKDCRKMTRRGADLRALAAVIEKLQMEMALPPENHDHELIGDFAGFRECHIAPDWLLIYYRQRQRLVLVCVRTGSHSDLFR